MSFDESQSHHGQKSEDDGYIKMVESGHIGFQLAEEVRSLREEILSLKQEKRMLLVTNDNLEESLSKANAVNAMMSEKVASQGRAYQEITTENAQQEAILKRLESDLREVKAQCSAARKKNKLLGQELERSLEDEVALRGYSRRLEGELAAFKGHVTALQQEVKVESEERLRCQHFIETALRYQMVHQKKLETVAYYCDKDVDLSTVSILDVSPDYLDTLMRDLRSDVLPPSASGAGDAFGLSAGAGKARFDFSSLDHRQRNIDHQLNQYLSNIRSHITKLRRAQGKSRKYVRQLLDVIHTHEELSSTAPRRPLTPDAQDSLDADVFGVRTHQHTRSSDSPASAAEKERDASRRGAVQSAGNGHHAKLRATTSTLLGELQDSLRKNFPV